MRASFSQVAALRRNRSYQPTRSSYVSWPWETISVGWYVTLTRLPWCVWNGSKRGRVIAKDLARHEVEGNNDSKSKQE